MINALIHYVASVSVVYTIWARYIPSDTLEILATVSDDGNGDPRDLEGKADGLVTEYQAEYGDDWQIYKEKDAAVPS